MNELSRRQQSALLSLADMNLWEAVNCAPLNTVSGRFLYFKIAQQVMREGTGVQALKDLHVDAHLSERAIRLKLREFEREGWIESVTTPSDKRTRQLVVTPKLLALIQAHAQALDQSLGQALLVIAKGH